jgi:hypothetical protein
MLTGASRSIDVLNPKHFYTAGIEIHQLAQLADARLRRRLIVALETERPIQIDGDVLLTKDYFRSNGWSVNRDPVFLAPMSCVLVDEKALYLVDPGKWIGDPASTRTAFIEGHQAVKPYQQYFDSLYEDWQDEWLWDDLLFPGFPENAHALATVSEENWAKVIKYLALHPKELYQLTPRRFEELIAALLEREGFCTTLTPRSKDGGIDILALTETVAGQHLYLVECKKYSPERPVGVSLVRALYGIVEQRGATGGLLVATSKFTRGAMQFRDETRYRLGLKGYEDLKSWLIEHTTQDNPVDPRYGPGT